MEDIKIEISTKVGINTKFTKHKVDSIDNKIPTKVGSW